MQLAMIGLGRMGGNLVRRLLRDGHDCVVTDVDAEAVAELVTEGATGAEDLAELVDRLARPRRVWIMIPAALVDGVIGQLAPLLDPGAVVIDGGNTLPRLDIARADALAGARPRRRIHQRRRRDGGRARRGGRGVGRA